jgi:hypothetical protein
LFKIKVINRTGTDVVFYLTSAVGELPVHNLTAGETYVSPTPICTAGTKVISVFDSFTEQLIGIKQVEVTGPTVVTLRPLEERIGIGRWTDPENKRQMKSQK